MIKTSMLQKGGLALLSPLPLVYIALSLVIKSDFGAGPGISSYANHLIS